MYHGCDRISAIKCSILDVKLYELRLIWACFWLVRVTQLHTSCTCHMIFTIIPRVRVGYEMVDSQLSQRSQRIANDLISYKHEWITCFIKSAQKNCNSYFRNTRSYENDYTRDNCSDFLTTFENLISDFCT